MNKTAKKQPNRVVSDKSKANLRQYDLSKRPDAREIQSRGGSRSTPKKKWAARLRELKKKGISNDNYKRIYEIMTEKESFALDNYLKLQQWLTECTDVKEKILIGRLLNDLMKNLHGEKLHTVNEHHHIDWNKVISNFVISKEASDRIYDEQEKKKARVEEVENAEV